MIIEHQLEFPKNQLDRQLVLTRIIEEIPEFFNWNAILKNEKISFEHDGKLRLIRNPADYIKSGTIELSERTNTLIFTCKTNYPNYFILIYLAILTVGLVQKYLLDFPFSLSLLIFLPFFLYFGNWFVCKRSFRWATNKVIKYVMQNEVGS